MLRRIKRKSPLSRSVIRAEFATRLGVQKRLHAQEKPVNSTLPDCQQAFAQAVTSQWSGIGLGLTGYEHAAGRWGVELRDPWADRRLVEFFLALPLNYKVRDGWLKYLPRVTFAADLGDMVAWRLGKEHLGWHFTRQLMHASREWVEKSILHDLDILDYHVDGERVKAWYQAYASSKNPLEEEFEGEFIHERLYEIVTLLHFVRRYC